MSEPSFPATAEHRRLPRYPGEQPMPQRTPTNDEEALKMAKLALQAKDRLKEKRKTKQTGGDGGAQKEEAQPENVKTEAQAKDPQIETGTAGGAEAGAHSQHEGHQSGQESTDSPPLPWPEVPFAYGDIPDLRLPLKSMYDGSGRWPKRTGHGGKKYSWSNIGFPKDVSIIVPDFEKDTHVDTTEACIMELAADVSSIRFKDPKEIADGAVESIWEDNRTIDTFKVHGRTVCRVKFSDVDAFGKGSPYSLSKVSKSLERNIDENFGPAPDLETERWVTAHVLLSMAGQIGGRTDDYWSRARKLAQEQLYVNPNLQTEVRQQIKAGDHEKDVAFSKMLALVKKGCPIKGFNLYHQAKRNNYATDNSLLHKVENTDIVMILDQSDNLILFQCSDVFNKLLTKAIQKLVVQSFDIYSSCTPLPFPDMTRHGLHWIEFLAERPDLDCRITGNDPRVAKSGLFHIGAHCGVGDPNGHKLPGPTKDNAGRRVPEGGHVFNQLMNLRYSAFGACTEISKFFFELLEPALLEEYVRVAGEVSRLGVPVQTTRSGEPFLMRALLVNLMTYEHQDTGDWHHGFAFLVPVGDYEGGDLVLRELGLRVEAPPGCLQMLRGRELRHSITAWTGRRFVCVSVIHEAVRRWALRRLGEEVPETPDPLAPQTLAECVGPEPEDVVPEDQASEDEMYYWLPEEEEFEEEEEDEDSEASLPADDDRKRPATSKRRAATSSDASAEASDRDEAKVKKQKTA